MRGLEIGHVTSFRPITRLYFRNLKIIRGTLYKIFWGFSLGFVTYGEYPHIDKYWGLSYLGYSRPYQNEKRIYLYIILVGSRIIF